MIVESSHQNSSGTSNDLTNPLVVNNGRCRIYDDPKDADRYVARQIADLVKERAAQGKSCVLGLATGSTPVKVYAELIRIHKEEKLSFANVVSFNLDEYFPMQPDSLQSYHRFMNENLFNHIDIPKSQIHIPDGTIPTEQIPDYCVQYEQSIVSAGGLDIQLLGIGRTGHIGFNEPGSRPESRTRLITLDAMTRIDAASAFFGIENVPRRAITMGVGTILQAKRVFLLAYGEGKSAIIAKAIEGEISPTIPATYLQNHSNCEYVLDTAASAMLSAVRTPWIGGTVVWDDKMLRKAVVWLSQLRNKPILTLTNGDYNENHLQDLLAEYGSAYEINLRVFRYLQGTITGWPAGKPDRQDCIFPKRIILFSPHPDDDVISMGGTLIRLATQGHEVHIAYQTSGNIAVFDDDAIRFAKFAEDFSEMFGVTSETFSEITNKIRNFVRTKGRGDRDIPELKKLKGLIRRGEAIDGAEVCGVPEERLHFLDLPFYETGAVRKKAIGEEDVEITIDLLRRLKPHQIYAAGDLSDPHGTHRTCLDILMKAIAKCESDDWYRECEVLLYRGAWQEWPAYEIEVAVPLSPQEVDRKRDAIFKHESQKDRAMFPGADAREFWQRAEDRNAGTARLYDKLGLAQYQAIEGFVKWKKVT